MARTESRPAVTSLAAARRSPDFVTYEVDLSPDPWRDYRSSIFGLTATGEIFVAVTRDGVTRVASFVSRYRSCTPEDRRAALTLVDSADAYELARRLNRYWRRRSFPPFP